jgi:hypothetical protein
VHRLPSNARKKDSSRAAVQPLAVPALLQRTEWLPQQSSARNDRTRAAARATAAAERHVRQRCYGERAQHSFELL